MKDIKIAVIGLGYVGLPLARLFSTRYPTTGYDMNASRVEAIMRGRDETRGLDEALLREAIEVHGLRCTSDPEGIRDANFYVVAVPTPVDANNRPDLRPLLSASETVGRVISRGDIVVYESTVYPGVTEEECLPLVERVSGLKLNEDFFAGYSPERINPGDTLHTVEKIKKVTSGSTPETADTVDEVYCSVIVAGTHRAPSIRIAEASKIIENSQRDVNIAFMNELAKIFNAMGIDTRDVLEAASTKWNFIPMSPGLVGGHCISVDPYYLIQKAQVYGVLPRVMSSARRLNDGMGDYVASRVIRAMNLKGLQVKDSRILILGFTFKENCPDTRNTRVIDIVHSLSDYTSNLTLHDPWADAAAARREYGVQLDNSPLEELRGRFDAVILAVAHDQYRIFSAVSSAGVPSSPTCVPSCPTCSGIPSSGAAGLAHPVIAGPDLPVIAGSDSPVIAGPDRQSPLTDIRQLLRDPASGVIYDVKGILDRSRIDDRL